MYGKLDPSVQMLRGGSQEAKASGIWLQGCSRICLGYRGAVFGGITAVSLLWNLESVLATGTCHKSMSHTLSHSLTLPP